MGQRRRVRNETYLIGFKLKLLREELDESLVALCDLVFGEVAVYFLNGCCKLRGFRLDLIVGELFGLLHG